VTADRSGALDDLPATLADLNDRYGIGGAIRFVAGPGGLPVAELRCSEATATVALLGATVTAFRPRSGAPVLFVSRESAQALGQPIRGGIPVCWPWFGPHPTDRALPNHGFVRTRLWSVEETATGEGDEEGSRQSGAPGGGESPETELTLRLVDDEETRALWPHAFSLRLVVRLGQTLGVALEARHTGERGDPPVSCTGALHTYLAVGDVSRISVRGLEGARYVDKVAGGAEREQEGPVTIGGETDRVYLGTAASLTVEDPALGRSLVVSKGGSRTTVVWNPWEGRARALPDLGDDEYREFVCVETANALEDAVELAPGETHRLETTISAG
jgi:D-hexose-6-phosphate mutarotase